MFPSGGNCPLRFMMQATRLIKYLQVHNREKDIRVMEV
jgi:hypothetical protein